MRQRCGRPLRPSGPPPPLAGEDATTSLLALSAFGLLERLFPGRLHGEAGQFVLGLLPLGVDDRGLAVALVGLLDIAQALVADAEVVPGALGLLGAELDAELGLLHALVVLLHVDQGR